MADKIRIAYGPLADFSTSPWGVLIVKSGSIELDTVKTFNRARLMLNAGANTFRILRRGIWECQQLFDFEDEGYWDLLTQYVNILHQPFQGDDPPPGADVDIPIFDGCSETWMYDPANYDRARALLRGMFQHLGNLPYVKFSVGNEMNHEGYKRLLVEVIIPEFQAAGKIPFKFGPCYSIHEDRLEETKGLHGMAWGDDAENKTYRAVHGVKDATSQTLIDACRFWMPANNPISIWFSVDGVWDGESQDGENGHFRPSPAQIKSAMNYWMDRAQSYDIAGHPKFAFEYLPKARNRDDLAVLGVLAINESYSERFGRPENYGQYPDDWKEPTPPEPPTPPVPVKPPFNWRGWWNNNHEYVYVSIIGILTLCALAILFIGGC